MPITFNFNTGLYDVAAIEQPKPPQKPQSKSFHAYYGIDLSFFNSLFKDAKIKYFMNKAERDIRTWTPSTSGYSPLYPAIVQGNIFIISIDISDTILGQWLRDKDNNKEVV